jgi:hypothetical protein
MTMAGPLFSPEALQAWYERRESLSTRIREYVPLPLSFVLDGTRESVRDELSRRVVGSTELRDVKFHAVRCDGADEIVFEVTGDITELVRGLAGE